VYAQRYNSSGAPRGGEFRVNAHTTDRQLSPSVAADADGGFLIAWASAAQDGAGLGVYARQYGDDGQPIGGEFRVNTYTTADQHLPTVAVDHAGDYVVAWTSFGQDGNNPGVFAQRYAESLDAAGPVVAGVFVTGHLLLPYSRLPVGPHTIVLSFSEVVDNATDPANWLLTRDGADITSDISSIIFGLNVTTNRYEAVLNLTTSYASGNFLVVARDTLHDASGNALDGNADGAPGGSFPLPFSVGASAPLGGEFRVNTYTPDEQGGPSVASNADGDFVAVWTSTGQDFDGFSVRGKQFAAGVSPGGEFEFPVNTFETGSQAEASVAMDAAGNFVVTWSSSEQEGSSDQEGIFDLGGIYAQRFTASGNLLGEEFHVNTFTEDLQYAPQVAMDADGDFVIAWVSRHDFGSEGVYAQRFSRLGVAQGEEFRVNSYTTGNQNQPSVAMRDDGAFVVAWESGGQDGDREGVYAQRYSAAGVAQGGEFRVNTTVTGRQSGPGVAMDADGDFVIAWSSIGQIGPGWSAHARRFNLAGTPQGAEFQVSAFPTGLLPGSYPVKTAMDARGNFVITWMSVGQDGDRNGIHARQYTDAGIPLGGEFRVNTFTTGDQGAPSVAMDSEGDYVIAWQSFGQDGSAYGVYAQRFGSNTPTVGVLTDTPDPVAAGNMLTLSASDITDDGTVTSVSFYRETNGVAGLQVGFQGDTLVGTANTSTAGSWSSEVPTTGLSGTYTYWAQATDDAGLAGQPASTTNTVVPGVPAVTASSFNFATLPQRLSFTFNQNVASSLGLEDIVIAQLPGGPTVTPSGLSYDAGTNTATFLFGTPLPDGRFRARLIASGIIGPGGQLPADHLFEFMFLRGDANGDGRVNLSDFNILAANFGASPRDFTQGDFDYSGVVNLADFNILASRFGVVLGPAAGDAAGDDAVDDELPDDLDDLLG
jgi:hypothetical protein